MPINKCEHKGKEVIYVDYQSCKSDFERLKQLEETAQFLSQHQGNALVLVDLRGQSGRSKEFMERAKELEPNYGHNVSKRAILGIDGLKKVLLMAFNRFSKNSTKTVPFDTKDKALDFLIT